MITIIKKFSILLSKKQKNRIFILFIITLIGACLEVLGVSLMLPLMSAIMSPDIIETNKTVKWVCELLDLHSHRTFVVVCIIALIFVFIVKDLFLMLEYYIQARFVYNNRFATQQRLLHAYMSRPYEYFLNAKSGEVLRVINEDTNRTFSLLMTLLGMLTEVVISIALIITIFVVDPLMTGFVAVILLLIMLLILKVVRPKLKREGVNYQKHYALTNMWMLQAINGIKEVKVSHKEEYFEKNYEKSGRKTIRAEKFNTVCNNIPRLLIEMGSVCSMLIVLAILIYKGRDMATLMPSLGAFAMAAVKLMPSANRIVGGFTSVSYLGSSVDKLIEDLKSLEEYNYADVHSVEAVGDAADISLEKEIVFKDISYKYPSGEQYVLERASMTVPVGKSVGIVGKSGSGKTTAVDIILGLLAPQQGQVMADGVDVMEHYATWLSHIGYIPQMIFMLDDTVRANVAFGIDKKSVDDTDVWKALEEAQLADFVRSLPDGLDTEIGERGVRLSGGQRQRIGIARALYPNPELIIFDEATSALDNETEAAIMESINSLHGKKTMIIIAHRLQTIEECDIVYRVEDGKIERER